MFATLDCIGKPQFVYAIKAILHLECMIIICTQHLIPPTTHLLWPSSSVFKSFGWRHHSHFFFSGIFNCIFTTPLKMKGVKSRVGKQEIKWRHLVKCLFDFPDLYSFVLSTCNVYGLCLPNLFFSANKKLGMTIYFLSFKRFLDLNRQKQRLWKGNPCLWGLSSE